MGNPPPPPHLVHLPAPSAEAAAHSARLTKLIVEEIERADGWISFARYMELALYAPGLGYYSAGARKFGPDGDFVTAPELGPLFARTLAHQAAQVLRETGGDILELGAGSGRLACDLLSELAALDCLPQRYLILETSAELKARQATLLQKEPPHFSARFEWLDTLPASFTGFAFGNEILDAMPVHMIRTHANSVDELGVGFDGEKFAWSVRPAQGALLKAARELNLPDNKNEDYTTEIGLAAQAFVRTLGAHIERGVALFIDYGFPVREYYHPQRDRGTLMCHYRQHAHDDPFFLVGLQDITAHVDFSAIAHAGVESGLEVLGYCGQARFLINNGITEYLEKIPAENVKAYLPSSAEAQKLLSPAEMGELFKVIALGKNFSEALIGFATGDRRHTL
jgi:SAM-dependent MidA family methyltransferase